MKLKIFLIWTAIFAYSSFAGPVSYYGKLQANGNRLVGSKTGVNKAVQVRGVSLGWSNSDWESAAFFNSTTVNALVDDWKAEIIRVPLGSTKHGGYDSQQANNKNRVIAAIDAAIAKDVYVIIDWHSHKAHLETNAAKAFFEEMAQTYGQEDNVIFEIYNEPECADGSDSSDNPNCEKTTWEHIKTYANTIIPAIRQYSDNLILVGTRNWSRRVDDVIGDELDYDNVAYVLHFYAQNHYLDRSIESQTGPPPSFREVITLAMNAGLPVFISEYGTTNSDGGQPGNNFNSHHAEHADEWLAFMDEKKISSCAWHVNDKYEGSAFFGTNSATTPNANRFPQTPANFINKSMMTASGQYIYDKLNAYAQTAEWLNPSPISVTKPSLHWNVRVVKNAVVLQVNADRVKLEIFDSQGRSVQTSRVFTGGNYTVPLNNLPQGLYFAKASMGSEAQVIRIPVF